MLRDLLALSLSASFAFTLAFAPSPSCVVAGSAVVVEAEISGLERKCMYVSGEVFLSGENSVPKIDPKATSGESGL